MISITLFWCFASIHLFLLLSMPISLCLGFSPSLRQNIKCVESERQALLSFQQRLTDEYGILSSWVNNDCCNWSAVRCSNKTEGHHVIGIDLRGSHDKYLKGEVGSSSLTQLSRLKYLDLSYNQFDRILLEDIGSLVNMNYLNLSYNWFKTALPPHLGNLSKLSVLDLGNNYWSSGNLRWLLSLSSLQHLDLSRGDFGGANDWVGVINQLPLLQSLSLSDCNLPPPILSSHSYTNFSRFLVELDLSLNLDLNSSIYHSWLINFTNIVHLNLAYNNLEGLSFDDFGNMTSLVSLDLSGTQVNFHSLKSFQSLRNINLLDLSGNIIRGLLSDFLKALHPRVLNSLQYLSLRINEFCGFLPNFTMLPSLKHLELSDNMLNGTIPQNSGQLSNLEYLDLHSNSLSGNIPQNLGQLSNLKYLDLGWNSLSGTIPQNLGQLSNLEYLDLHSNSLSGTIPQNLGQLSNLEYLDLHSNSLEGEVSEAHFSKLINLKRLDLSNNSLSLNLKTDWVPSFQLDYIILGQCNLGPLFPEWLRTQTPTLIDISFAGISDIVPHWFWNNLSPGMDLSGNKMMGEIPNLSLKFNMAPVISLKSNKFVGRIPAFLFQAEFLHLSSNDFSDLSGLCEIVNSPLETLDLSDNQLSGQLPDCWDSMLHLKILNLSNNYFFGDVPHSIGNLIHMESLVLRNNQFSGGLPFLFNLTYLGVIDAMNNNLSGTIPSWIGSKIPYLTILNLKSNHFHGNLGRGLCNLKYIQILDISSNNVSGSIPTCIRNFNALTQTLFSGHPNYETDIFMVWKGGERHITGQVMDLVRSIDLSCNHLSGKIPYEITQLVELIILNLSRNELTGQIPDKIGRLQSLESLDLSRNHLSGPIPSHLSQVFRLGVLDLSYNNLSGKIPMGTQLQGFSTSSYEGNPYLCGDPLKKCSEDINQEPNINNVHVENENEDEDKLFGREFLISMAFGFIVGFWGIFGSLVLNRRWRHAFFKFFRCENN
ncbi:receptor-like protein 12 [Momordica charantia]|uniref:Receptor-like protein 12 n=1 Tax=Momordica charantia TaxID=3673 RepID=A0A6J1C6V9_MOMCH|nr:receptor-like protein 12 [Momordica charantia]